MDNLTSEYQSSDHRRSERTEQGKRNSSSHSPTSTRQVVEFQIGSEQFAVDLFDTREVITTPDVTPIPNVPPYIKGIIDLRGVITTVVDLREIMQITKTSTDTKRSRIIVLDKDVSERRVGILVDDVSSVTTYNLQDIDLENQASHKNVRDILGIIHNQKRDKDGKETRNLVILLDIKSMIRRVEKDI